MDNYKERSDTSSPIYHLAIINKRKKKMPQKKRIVKDGVKT